VSWQEAKTAAQEWAEAAGFAGELRGRMLLLPSFDSDEDCRFFLPDRGLGFHRMMVKAAARTARKAGAQVIPVLVRPKDYRGWLRAGEIEDSPARRAEYLKDKTKVV